MPDTDSLILFVGAALLLLLTPGPAVLFIIARSVEQGRRAGIVSSLGLGLGGLLHVAAAASGVSAILAASASAFQVVKLLGAAYLVYLGLQALRFGGEARATTPVRVRSMREVFREGVLVQLLNPKPALFLMAFLPQFVDPARGSSSAQVVFLGLLFVGLAVLTDVAYALVSGTARAWFQENPRALRLQRRCAGWTYIGLGAVTALAERER